MMTEQASLLAVSPQGVAPGVNVDMALDRGDHCGPLGTGEGGRPRACPARTRAQQGQPVLATITTTEVSTVSGEPRLVRSGRDRFVGVAETAVTEDADGTGVFVSAEYAAQD
jgi:hypothetical protein